MPRISNLEKERNALKEQVENLNEHINWLNSQKEHAEKSTENVKGELAVIRRERDELCKNNEYLQSELATAVKRVEYQQGKIDLLIQMGHIPEVAPSSDMGQGIYGGRFYNNIDPNYDNRRWANPDRINR